MNCLYTRQRPLVRFAAALLAALFFLPLSPLCAAAQEQTQVVRVGYYITPGFQEYDPLTDTYNGYSYEYLLAIAQYSGWQYDFVPVTSSEALTMLAQGKLDLVNNVSRTPTRTYLYDFSDLPSGQNYACLVMLPERAEEVAFEEYSKFSSLSVALVRDRSYSDAFISHCLEHDAIPHIVYYDTSEEARAAWQAGETDAYVATSTYNMDYHILTKFHPENFYFATTKGNEQLLSQLNAAMNTLNTEDPYFESTLYSKYYSNMAENNCILTDEERDFAANNPPIKVVYDQTEYPLSYKDDNGEFAGAMRQIFDLICEKTGLRFRYIPCDSNVANATAAAGDTNYIIAELPYDYKFGKQNNVYLTRPFTTISCMKVSGKNDENGGVMAIVDGYYLGSLCREVYGSSYTYAAYPTTRACIDAVRSGEADATCMTSLEYEYYASQSAYRALFYKVAHGVEYQLSIAAAQGVDPLIKSILSKAINVISTSEIQTILRQTTSTMQRPDLVTLLYQYPQAVLPLVVLLGLLAGALLLFFVSRHMSNKNRLVLESKNEQLQDAMEQANNANLSKSQFLAQMSHEIRTPMNAIVGMTAMAHHTVNDPQKTTEYLDKIDTSSKMLLGIINDVLDMSAIESNKLKIASEVFDLKQIITGLTTVYYPQCKAKGVELTVIAHLEHEMLVGDALRVNQVLMNLMSNAYKFTEHGGHIRLEVTEQHPKDSSVFIRFVVADDGCGMSEDLKGRLFQSFEQESAVTARKHGGSGLGLAITKNLVDKMHGAIEVSSELGKGTTFTVSLPFPAAPDQTKADPAILRGMLALVVDDSRQEAEYAQSILDRMGVGCDLCATAQEALEKVAALKQQGRHYDLCLTDWKMPGMDGMELTRRLRQIAPEETLVIVISAYDLSEMQEEAKAAGADMCLEKPFFQSTLFNVLLALRQRRKQPWQPQKEPGDLDFTGKRVLLVDDFDMNLEVARDILEMVHFTVDTAENGQEAVDAFTSSTPGTYDAILMDIQMPVMDGLEAARTIRRSGHPQAASIPIYAMTANAFTEDVAAATNAGMNGHISKPVDTAALYKLLDGVLHSDS